MQRITPPHDSTGKQNSLADSPLEVCEVTGYWGSDTSIALAESR